MLYRGANAVHGVGDQLTAETMEASSDYDSDNSSGSSSAAFSTGGGKPAYEQVGLLEELVLEASCSGDEVSFAYIAASSLPFPPCVSHTPSPAPLAGGAAAERQAASVCGAIASRAACACVLTFLLLSAAPQGR